MTIPDGTPELLPGGGIGARIARTVADATVATRAKMAPHTNRVAQQVLTDFTNHVSDEVRSVMGPLWRKLADSPDAPTELRGLLHALGTQRGQAWAWIGGTATGAALGGGLLNLLTNYLNPVVTPLIAESPQGILAPSDAAAAVARGIDTGIDMRYEARKSGMNDPKFDALVALHRALPTTVELFELVNRGVLTEDQANTLLRLVGYRTGDAARLLTLRNTEHSAEQVAAMWNRGIMTEEEAIRLNARVGTDDVQTRRLLELGGEPPGPEELLLAWRRGIVDEAQVDRALRQSPLRFEWIPVIKSLQWTPLPTSEAADAVNQQHMTEAEGEEAARINGIRPEDFRIFVANAGIPPGPQTVLDWVNRGLMTEAEALSALYESRIKNRWVPTYLKSRHETMPPETIRLMYRRGALTREQALTKLQIRGYSPEDAAIILNGASSEKTEGARDLTVSQVIELYTEQMITETDALSMLEAYGYDDTESRQLLDLADIRRVRKYVNAVVTRVRSAYVNGNIDEITAGSTLDTLGLPAEFKDTALSLWDMERATVSRGLTVAQITNAVKKALLTVDDAMRRLTGQGYSGDDAMILLQLGGAVPTPG